MWVYDLKYKWALTLQAILYMKNRAGHARLLLRSGDLSSNEFTGTFSQNKGALVITWDLLCMHKNFWWGKFNKFMVITNLLPTTNIPFYTVYSPLQNNSNANRKAERSIRVFTVTTHSVYWGYTDSSLHTYLDCMIEEDTVHGLTDYLITPKGKWQIG